MGQMYFPDDSLHIKKHNRILLFGGICFLLLAGCLLTYYWYYDWVPFDVDLLRQKAYDYYLSDDVHDQEKAFRLYKRAAQLGDEPSIVNAAYCLEQGRGTPVDYKEAIKWYSRNEHDNYKHIGRIYEHIGNYKKAMTYYKRMEDSDWGKRYGAYYYIGRLYEEGKGVDKDIDIAVMYYKKGVEWEDYYSKERLKELGVSP